MLPESQFKPGSVASGAVSLTKPIRSRVKRHTATLALLTLALTWGSAAYAQQVMSPGDAVVTGFSGIAPLSDSGDGSSFGIDLAGPSAEILSLGAISSPPDGTFTTAPSKKRITAGEVGQVFAITLDDRGNGKTPNIFLGATSLFGINIVDQTGAERLETGEAGAQFMKGQFGPDGSAGSIWRVDGVTGAITEFTRLPDNSGPGVGDVVFDKATRQFFASDLDTGLIHRISPDGGLIDTFDHGLSARPKQGFPPVADDGKQMDISSPQFDTSNPDSWGYTQAERRVWGMAVHNGRLYYATVGTPQIWSVGIGENGSFLDDARLEIQVEGLAGPGPITDMLFDSSGRMYLAQRGKVKPSFNFSEFAEPGQSNVLRYRPVTSGQERWSVEPQSYAIGIPPDHNAANGGIALGYAHNDSAPDRFGACGQRLWSTGDRLVSSDPEGTGAPDVHGLQGNAIAAVRPQNAPPQVAHFVDYDGFVGDATNAGHIGDVEVFAPCGTSRIVPVSGQIPPGYWPPGTTPPPTFPPVFPPPPVEFNTNLKLVKRATPRRCFRQFGGWSCQYEVRVINTGPDQYFGDVQIKDTLPAAPAGAVFGVGPMPPWACWMSSASSVRCWRPNVFLNPGQGLLLNVNVWVPSSYRRCRLRNVAEIEWAPGGTQWNTDPGDDRDGASSRIPSPRCLPVHRPVGSVVHQPVGSFVHRPIGSDVHRPVGSRVHRPRGSNIHRPRGSNVHLPVGSRVHRPRGSYVHRPRGSYVHRPVGSNVHLPVGSKVHRPRGSKIHRPRGSVIHLPRGSKIHRPRGSKIHRPRGSKIHRPRGSVIHLPRGSKIHRPRGSKVHRPRGSKIHRPRGSKIHLPGGSRIRLPGTGIDR